MNNEIHTNLPGASTITTLWIIGLVLVLLGCCCGILSALPALIISIVGLVMANKNIKLYYATPDDYVAHSYSSVKTGKIMNIIVLILSSLTFLFYMLYFVLYGAAFWTGLYKAFDQDSFQQYETYDDTVDDWNTTPEVYEEWEEDIDTISNDTLIIESIEVDSIQN